MGKIREGLREDETGAAASGQEPLGGHNIFV
jgi:hypothetical protein